SLLLSLAPEVCYAPPHIMLTGGIIIFLLSLLVDFSFMDTETNTIELGGFDGLVKLKSVEISSNPLRSVPVGLFKDNSNLETIILKFNKLVGLEKGLFDGLTNLVDLQLHGNEIELIEDQTFDELVNLKKLNLGKNNLTSVSTSWFSKLKNLAKLDLSKNYFLNLSPDYFEGPEKLTEINVQGNMINSLDGQLFENLQFVTTIKLANNDLRTLSGDVFDSLTKLKKLDLSNNPWQCDCNLIDFYHWIKTNADKLTLEVHCEYPEHLKGQEIKLLNEDQLVCPTLPPTTITLPTTIPTTLLGCCSGAGVKRIPHKEALVLDVAVAGLILSLVTFAACLPSLSLPTFLSEHFQIKATRAKKIHFKKMFKPLL
uniref:LRRCT domain-containing protein n=1 Tax=Poecilia reticulata TaxID=8081 RepID=A0A3P9PLU9_POERE